MVHPWIMVGHYSQPNPQENVLGGVSRSLGMVVSR